MSETSVPTGPGRRRQAEIYFAGVRGKLPRVPVDPARLDFTVRAAGRRLRVIGVVPDQLLTEALVMKPRVEGGLVVADPGRDLAKIAVVERHHASGRAGHP